LNSSRDSPVRRVQRRTQLNVRRALALHTGLFDKSMAISMCVCDIMSAMASAPEMVMTMT
jgi:hypothetical protein